MSCVEPVSKRLGGISQLKLAEVQGQIHAASHTLLGDLVYT